MLLGLTLQANLPFVAVAVVLVLGLVVIVLAGRSVAVKIGRVEGKVDAIDKAVNQSPGVPIKEHARVAAVESKASNDRLVRLERHQEATFDRLDLIDARMDGHAVHLAGIGARVAAIADHLNIGSKEE